MNASGSPTDSVKHLSNFTVFELLDVLKSLGCPLKARKCLDHVGVSGKDFGYYGERDLVQIGVQEPAVVKKCLQIKSLIVDTNSGFIPEWLMKPISKRGRKSRDARIAISSIGFAGWDWGHMAPTRGAEASLVRNEDGMWTLHKSGSNSKKPSVEFRDDTHALLDEVASLADKAAFRDDTQIVIINERKLVDDHLHKNLDVDFRRTKSFRSPKNSMRNLALEPQDTGEQPPVNQII
jgi:hypothetical protein